MKLNNIILAGVLAVSASGCGDADDAGGRAVTQAAQDCVEQHLCEGDTICGQDGDCEPAFDRDYQVRLNLFVPIRDEQCEARPSCPSAPVEIYYSELSHPILTGTDPGGARIHVVAGSSLIIELAADRCTIELTAERLRRGAGTCTSGGVSATLALTPVPLEADATMQR